MRIARLDIREDVGFVFCWWRDAVFLGMEDFEERFLVLAKAWWTLGYFPCSHQ